MRVAAVITLLIMISFAVGAEQSPTQGDGLSLNLRNLTEHRFYGMKDCIVLEFEVINLSSKPVGVFAGLGMGYQGGMILHLLDATGAEVQRATVDSDPLDTDAIIDARGYFMLKPYMFFGTRQKYAVPELVRKPGRLQVASGKNGS